MGFRTHRSGVSEADRFWAKVRPGVGDACWEWTGGLTKGYGYFKLTGCRTNVYAHRWSWQAEYGPIQAGRCVLHRCDNPLCVKPTHLFLGTIADNNRDSRTKNRHQHGEGASNSKLTDAQIVEIRRAAATGHTYLDVASRFGVTESNIGQIVRRKTWQHVKE